MDQEVKSIVQQVHDRTLKIIEDHQDAFMQMGSLLLEKEVIFADDIEKILGPKVKEESEETVKEDEERNN